MVDRLEEVLKFVKANIKVLVMDEFPDKIYKEAKKSHFFDALRNQVGIPKDTEIAAAALDYLLRVNYFVNQEQLEQLFKKPFFSRNVSDPEYYLQKFLTQRQKIDLDAKRLQDEEYKADKLKELQEQIINEKSTEIDRRIKEKEARYESIPSILDNDVNYPEPLEVEEEKPDKEYLPWWQKLRLRADPFPTIDGLGSIKEEDYEEIIVKTSIYEKYVSYIKNTPGELFKNTVFYGQFGSGKTTFFEYLQKPLIQHRIYPIFIRLSAEPDYQNFLIRFKQKLFRELIITYRDLSGGIDLTNAFESSTLDENITEMFRKISQAHPCIGFVIMIDDIYKIKDYTNVALRFLNHLQTFRGELMLEAGFSNIGFFVSAPLDWKQILDENLVFSGSVSRATPMPMITMHEALNMLNRRLEAFAINKDNSKKFKIDFVHQIYRRLESKNALTFRQFIKEVVQQFENGNFDILVSNPVVIDEEVLRKIRQKFEQDFTVTTGINEILNASMTQKSKLVCFQLLIQILLQKGVADDSALVMNRMFYFMALKKAKLIVKTRDDSGKTIWKVSVESANLNNKINAEYSYSIEDYFFKLYSDRLGADTFERDIVKEEITKCKALLSSIKGRKNFETIYSLVTDALSLHEKIVKKIDNPSINIDHKQLKADYHQSILLISRAVAIFSGYKEVVSLNFWNDFPYYPDSVSDYIKRASADESRSSTTRTWYIGAAYVSAFEDILDYLADQIEMSKIYNIPVLSLKPEEFRDFVDARAAYARNNYDETVRIVVTLVESKIRELLYNIFSIQYGERHKRANRIPAVQQKYIRDNVEKDNKDGLNRSDNEFSYLNRHDYKSIIIGPGSPGNKNWAHTFSKIFFDWRESDLEAYLDRFARLNLQSAHNKQGIVTQEQQAILYEFQVKSIDFIRRINRVYVLLLKGIQRVETGRIPKYNYYFTLDDGKDQVELVEIQIPVEEAKRLLDLWKSSAANHVDLSNKQQIEQKYGIPYRQFYAILAMLINHSAEEMITISKENSPYISFQATVKKSAA